jgi:hypothetical protein
MHTPGKLQATVKSPSGWVDLFVEEKDSPSLPFISCKHHDPAANARRLIAVWNYCDGLTTEHLEQMIYARENPFNDDDWYVVDVHTMKVKRRVGCKAGYKPEGDADDLVLKGMNARRLGVKL